MSVVWNEFDRDGTILASRAGCTLLFLVGLLVTSVPAMAQDAAPAEVQTGGPFADTALIDAEPVVLIDADGNPLPLLTAAELQELVGPIALYPDDLLAIVLPASAYPLQIVMAARYLDRLGSDSTLRPDEDWDESVVALLNYPEVVQMMSEDLDWTWQLGEAVITQETAVINAVSSFRTLAYEAGNLASDNYQTVETQSEAITIRQVDEQVVYVPYYEPAEVIVYQPRPVYSYYPTAYPVYYYPYAPDYRFSSGFFWGVTTAFAIGWNDYHLHVYHPSYRRHPYYGRRYSPRNFYRQPNISVFNRIYVDNSRRRPRDVYRDGSFWRPQHNSGSRPRKLSTRRYEAGVRSGRSVRRYSSDRRTDQRPVLNNGSRRGADFADRIRAGNRSGWSANSGNPRVDRARRGYRSQSGNLAESRIDRNRNNTITSRLNRADRNTANRVSERGNQNRRRELTGSGSRRGANFARQGTTRRESAREQSPFTAAIQNNRATRRADVPRNEVLRNAPARNNRRAVSSRNDNAERALSARTRAPSAVQSRQPERNQRAVARSWELQQTARTPQRARPAQTNRAVRAQRNPPAIQANRAARSQQAAPRSRDMQRATRSPQRSQPARADRGNRAQRNQGVRNNRAQPGNRGMRPQARAQRQAGNRSGGNRGRRVQR